MDEEAPVPATRVERKSAWRRCPRASKEAHATTTMTVRAMGPPRNERNAAVSRVMHPVMSLPLGSRDCLAFHRMCPGSSADVVKDSSECQKKGDECRQP